jgi:hypothetical protein
LLSAFRIRLGFLIAFGTPNMTDGIEAARRFLGFANSGEAIDGGMKWLVVAIALGIMAEISARLVHLTQDKASTIS